MPDSRLDTISWPLYMLIFRRYLLIVFSVETFIACMTGLHPIVIMFHYDSTAGLAVRK